MLKHGAVKKNYLTKEPKRDLLKALYGKFQRARTVNDYRAVNTSARLLQLQIQNVEAVLQVIKKHSQVATQAGKRHMSARRIMHESQPSSVSIQDSD